MKSLVEEYARRPVQLGNDDTLRAVDHESTGRCHIRDIAEIYVLYSRVKILVFRITARKAEFCLQRNIVCESSFKTFFNRILRRIDEIIDELKHIVVPRILDWEYFLEYLIQPFVLSVLRGRIELEEVSERLQLHLEEIRIIQDF